MDQLHRDEGFAAYGPVPGDDDFPPEVREVEVQFTDDELSVRMPVYLAQPRLDRAGTRTGCACAARTLWLRAVRLTKVMPGASVPDSFPPDQS